MLLPPKRRSRTMLLIIAAAFFILLNLLLSGFILSRFQLEQHDTSITESKTLFSSLFRNSDFDQAKQEIAEAREELKLLKQQFKNQTTSKPFLILGIPTVVRSGDPPYLLQTLERIDKQLVYEKTHPLFGMIHVHILDSSDNQHKVFEQAKLIYSTNEFFHFYKNDNQLADPKNKKDLGTPNVPGWHVRKQTRNVVRLMQLTHSLSEYYMFMEDDFEMCAHSIPIIEYLIDKMSKLSNDNWISLKLSYGLNGFLLRNGADSLEFSNYLLEHQSRRPPDHLQTEWSAGEKPQSAKWKNGRFHFVYRYNLFSHLGTVSSLREQPNPPYPICYHEMNTEVVFEVESFRSNECADDDLWPCKNSPIYQEWFADLSSEQQKSLNQKSMVFQTYNVPCRQIEEAQET